MAETIINQFTEKERLGKQVLDVITVTLTTDAETIGDNKVFAKAIEIPYATSMNGGSGLIKSITILTFNAIILLNQTNKYYHLLNDLLYDYFQKYFKF